MSRESEKRRVQRVELDEPITAILNKHSVQVIDLSTTGARIEHAGPIGGGKRAVTLSLDVEGRALRVACDLVRSRLQRSALDKNAVVYSSGLRFTDPLEESRSVIRALVARLIERRAMNPSAGEPRAPMAV